MTSRPANQPPDTAESASEALLAKYNNFQELQRMGVELYPHEFRPSHKAGPLQAHYQALPAGEKTGDAVTVAGRVMSIRNSGMFIDLRDPTGKVQIYTNLKDI